jgi:hypothetical protein
MSRRGREIEVAPVVVAKVARRIAERDRRTACRMRVYGRFGAVFAGLSLLAALVRGDAGMAKGALAFAAVFCAGPFAVAAQRRGDMRAALRIAEIAETDGDVDWVHADGLLRAHDRRGEARAPALAVKAREIDADRDLGLPPARVIDR